VKKRFPDTPVFLAGPRKCWELFEADSRVAWFDVPYPRSGPLRDRLAAVLKLRRTLPADAIVIDPDSRLTQLGLLPVCDDDRYFFFESRAAGDSRDTLGAITRRWTVATFGVEGDGYIAPAPVDDAPQITISLGVGGNQRKRVPDPFERELMNRLAGPDILVDRGAGGEEADRVAGAIAGLPRMRTWDGSFAGFAARIARSSLYAGYDSAGQHAAAALGIPLVTVFAGFTSDRMFHRWRPSGRGPIEVVRVDDPDPVLVLEETLDAVRRLAPYATLPSR